MHNLRLQTTNLITEKGLELLKKDPEFDTKYYIEEGLYYYDADGRIVEYKPEILSSSVVAQSNTVEQPVVKPNKKKNNETSDVI